MSADMPPLRGECPLWQAVFAWCEKKQKRGVWLGIEAGAVDAEVQAYARAYADAQVRELVEALKASNKLLSRVHMEVMLYDGMPSKALLDAIKDSNALIAKHEKQTTNGG